jgi:UDP-glucose 4-epimerase
VLGGTRFIGRAAVEELTAAGHELLIVHRGGSEPPELARHSHVHVDRAELGAVGGELRDFAPDVVLDCRCMTENEATTALAVLPRSARLVVLSSADVYQAYASRDAGEVSEMLPFDETAPVRTELYPYRGHGPGLDDYEKILVERAYLARGGTALRLGFIYGPHDPQRREEFILRRVRAGRQRIPAGAGNWVLSRGYVADVAVAIRLAVESETIAGEVFNIAERRSPTVRLWAQQILHASGSKAELVRVPERALPEDLAITAAMAQHMLFDSSKARQVLGWVEGDPLEQLRHSVAWHMANPPGEANEDFSADDAALALATR